MTTLAALLVALALLMLTLEVAFSYLRPYTGFAKHTEVRYVATIVIHAAWRTTIGGIRYLIGRHRRRIRPRTVGSSSSRFH